MKEKIPSSKGGQAKIILPRLSKQALRKFEFDFTKTHFFSIILS